jgi:hypothetical protein
LVEKLLRVQVAVHEGTVTLFLVIEKAKLGNVLTCYFLPSTLQGYEKVQFISAGMIDK